MIITRVARLQDSVRFRLAEWGLAAVLFQWGWILLLPAHSFDLPSMAGLARVAPEWAWGTGLLALGCIRLFILVLNGAWKRNAHARAFCAGISCFAWLQISLGLLTTGIIAPGVGVYPLFLLMDIYVVFRAAGDAREADEARRDGHP